MHIPGTWHNRPRFKQFLPQLSAAMLWASLMIACGDGGSQGAMGQAAFGGSCGPDDISCLHSGIDAPIAVGATFSVDVRLQIQGSILPSVFLESSNPEIVQTAGNDITAIQQGVVALLLNTNQGEVLDFIHVWTHQPDRLAFHRLTKEGEDLGELEKGLQLLTEDEIFLGLRPFFEYQPLLGTAPTEWALDSSAMLMLKDGAEERRRFVARTPGQAQIIATTMGLTAQLNIEVLP